MAAGFPADRCTAEAAARRFDIDFERACVIQIDPERPAHEDLAGPVVCIGIGPPLLMPDHLQAAPFTEVAVGTHHVCALHAGSEPAERRAACWGTVNGNQFGQLSGAPHVGLHSLCSGAFYACGLVLPGQAPRYGP